MFGKLYERIEEEGAYVYRPTDNFNETNAKAVKRFIEQVADDATGLEKNYKKLLKKADKQWKDASKTENRIKCSIKKAYGESVPEASIKIPVHKDYTIKVKNEYAFNILHESLDNMHNVKYFSYKDIYNLPIGLGAGYGFGLTAFFASSLIPLVGMPVAAGAVGVLYYKSKKNDAREAMFHRLSVLNG